MSSTQTANYSETVSYPKQVSFTLATRHDSGFSKDGGKTRINAPKHKNIISEDRCVLTEKFVALFNDLWGSEYLTVSEKGTVRTKNDVALGSLGTEIYKRYIKGSNVIFKTEQEKLNIKPTRDDGIYMLWGDYSVDAKNKPTDKGLWIYLLIHNGNADYELRDNSIHAPAFKIQDNRKNAIKDLEVEDKRQEARDIVYQLKDSKTKGFNKDKMQFYTNVFRTQISGYDSDEEKFRALLTIADTKPDVIISGINKENVEYLQVIQQAIGLGILTRGAGKYMNTNTYNPVVKFKAGLAEELVIEKMVDYYASQDGAAEFTHLRNSVEAMKQLRVGEKG